MPIKSETFNEDQLVGCTDDELHEELRADPEKLDNLRRLFAHMSGERPGEDLSDWQIARVLNRFKD